MACIRLSPALHLHTGSVKATASATPGVFPQHKFWNGIIRSAGESASTVFIYIWWRWLFFKQPLADVQGEKSYFIRYWSGWTFSYYILNIPFLLWIFSSCPLPLDERIMELRHFDLSTLLWTGFLFELHAIFTFQNTSICVCACM